MWWFVGGGVVLKTILVFSLSQAEQFRAHARFHVRDQAQILSDHLVVKMKELIDQNPTVERCSINILSSHKILLDIS